MFLVSLSMAKECAAFMAKCTSLIIRANTNARRHSALCRLPPCRVPTEASRAQKRPQEPAVVPRALRRDFARNQPSYRVLLGMRVECESRVRANNCSSVAWPYKVYLVSYPPRVFPIAKCVCAFVSGVAK